jgi:hypothetical protein
MRKKSEKKESEGEILLPSASGDSFQRRLIKVASIFEASLTARR